MPEETVSSGRCHSLPEHKAGTEHRRGRTDPYVPEGLHRSPPAVPGRSTGWVSP